MVRRGNGTPRTVMVRRANTRTLSWSTSSMTIARAPGAVLGSVPRYVPHLSEARYRGQVRPAKRTCSVPSGRSPVMVTATVRPCAMVAGDTDTVTAGPARTDAARTRNVNAMTQPVRIEGSLVIIVNSLAQLRAARFRGAGGS